MSKYDFEIDTSLSSSTGIILNKIKEGQTILEFGCATGRMTKYMKEKLNCQVYIVEMDKDAYDIAIKYANGGICEDLMKFGWVTKFRDISFDAVIFADVLEHVKDAGSVLTKVVRLLKDDGHIYISIPNITHNDVLIKAANEHFDYSKTGLLDDTHVHFWGFENIQPFIHNCGLSVEQIEGTYMPTLSTEQKPFVVNTEKEALLVNALKEREFGEVYQFIITVSKKDTDYFEANKAFNRAVVKSHLYFDAGSGFNETELIELVSGRISENTYEAKFVLNNTDNIDRVRLDPIEGQGCILEKISIEQRKKELELTYSDSIDIDDGKLMLGNDPQIISSEIDKSEPVNIYLRFIILGNKYIEKIRSALVNKNLEFNRDYGMIQQENKVISEELGSLRGYNEILLRDIINLCGKTTELTDKNNDIKSELIELYDRHQSEKKRLEEDNDRLTSEKEKLLKEKELVAQELSDKFQNQLVKLQKDNNQLEADINANKVLLNKKDELLISNERLLNEKLNDLIQMEKDLMQKDQRINDLKSEIIELNDRHQSEKKRLEEDNVRLANEKEMLLKEKRIVTQELSDKFQNQLVKLQKENDQLGADINAYKVLLNKKEELLISDERLLNEKQNDLVQKENDLLQKENDLQQKDQRINELEYAVNHYQNLWYIKLRAFFSTKLKKNMRI